MCMLTIFIIQVNIFTFVRKLLTNFYLNILAFWNLVLVKGLSNVSAEKELQGTLAADKNEILFKEFGINYNETLSIFRKGTILLRKQVALDENRKRKMIIPIHGDLIKNTFWNEHDELLIKGNPKMYEFKDTLPELVNAQLDQLNLD